jgi:quercetin dioxygenase-like cupin family protein
MTSIIKKNLNQPDETQMLEKQKVESYVLAGFRVQRVTAEPGWQWSKHAKPQVGGESCHKTHLLYMLSGKMHVKLHDGTEADFGPGELVFIPPDHDGGNNGKEPAIWLELYH